MGDIRLHEGELNVMELLWSNQSLAAKDIAKIIKDYIGWEKNTTYTVIKRLIDKGAVKREDPGFLCKAVITKNEVQQIETRALIDKVYGGELIAFFTEFLANQNLDAEEVRELRKILDSQYRRLL
jgi:predicted transcriptional regulator